MSQCHLLEVMKKLDRKICGVNGCNLQHNYLLHPDQGRASVNMFTVLEDEDVAEEAPASKEEDEDDQSPRTRLMRGILQARRSTQDSREYDEDTQDSPGDQEEAVREKEAVSEDEKELEPKKEKNSQVQDEEANPDYCSMEARAERWRDKPRRQETASTSPEVGD